MDAFPTPFDLVAQDRPENPVACIRPGRAGAAARWFADRFPGRALYAVKANPAPWAIDEIFHAGITGFDVASPREMRAVAERCPGAELAFLHPIKSRRAIAEAYFDFDVRIFALDSLDELDKLHEATGGATDLTLMVRLAVDNDSALLPLVGKFGVSAFDATDVLRAARRYAARFGVSFHVGSQCMDPRAFGGAMAEASRRLTRAGVTAEIVDAGGGFPSIYPGMTPPPLDAYATAIAEGFETMNVVETAELWCEPGRALVAETTSLVVRVELRKGDALFINDGAYGNLFDAAHMDWRFPARLLRPHADNAAELAPFRLFGPTCDSIDAMAGPFDLPADIREGDYIEIGQIGAYGATMRTQFNGFGETREVTVADRPWPSLYDATPLPPADAEEAHG
ncbi:MAG: type III PLP-dependent enzyme [Maricaulaceae bacterium]